MYAVMSLIGMMLFTCAIAVWATYQETDQGDKHTTHARPRLTKAA